MIDRIFFAAFTFCLLASGTVFMGSALFGTERSAAASMVTPAPDRAIQLERVVIIGKRLAPATAVAQTATTETSTRQAQ